MKTHGRPGTYNAGRRCAPCCTAATGNVAEQRASRARRLEADPSLAPHGMNSTYANWRCRCDKCVAAHASYEAAYRIKRRKGEGRG